MVKKGVVGVKVVKLLRVDGTLGAVKRSLKKGKMLYIEQGMHKV